MNLTLIQIFAISVLPVLFAITVHEVAHGYVAYLFGDKTAQVLGRLTLNPIKHIDLIGTILVPVMLLLLNSGVIFGWAKPVPISVRNLRNPRRDMALVSLAGPLSNLVMLFLWAAIAKLGLLMVSLGLSWASALFYMGEVGIVVNGLLFILNIIPIPPLDGGHVLMAFLPPKLAFQLHRFERYGFIVLAILLLSGLLSHVLMPAVSFFQVTASAIFHLPVPTI